VDDTALNALADEPFGWRAKGFPLDGRFATAAQIRRSRPSLFEDGFVTPVATLRASALDHNLSAMGRFCAEQGIELAPHGKTTMAPQLFARQIENGAWGITVATPWQARVCRAFGVRRILLANELTDPAALTWVADELADEELTLMSYVDDPAQVERAQKILGDHGSTRPLDVLVEVGLPEGGRTGCRDAAAVDDVVRAVQQSSQHRLVGVAGYEGLIGHEGSDDVLARVRDFLRSVRGTAERLVVAGAFPGDAPVVLSAGGSAFFDIVTESLAGELPGGRVAQVVLRSGGYASHDADLYGDVSPFRRRPDLAGASGELEQAVEVWGRVLSRPEPGLALVDVGKRDVPVDVALPLPLRQRRDGVLGRAPGSWTLTGTNDQHGYLAVPPETDLAPGDWVSFAITHPCTFFDKWTWIPVVDDDERVVDVVRTYF
jgi:D-serine deaminase-like pyridoxal phosphate-dependent protein